MSAYPAVLGDPGIQITAYAHVLADRARKIRESAERNPAQDQAYAVGQHRALYDAIGVILGVFVAETGDPGGLTPTGGKYYKVVTPDRSNNYGLVYVMRTPDGTLRAESFYGKRLPEIPPAVLVTVAAYRVIAESADFDAAMGEAGPVKAGTSAGG